MSLLPKDVHDSWKGLLTPEFLSELGAIESNLDALPVHSSGYAYFPEKNRVMRFLESDVKNIKCVILGMEPYPSWYTNHSGAVVPVATGRSFEIDSVDSWQQRFKQTSLRNILKTVYFNATGKNEALESVRCKIETGEFTISEPHEWFSRLEEQGVLFLNATLTVAPANPDSHTDMWYEVMCKVIQYIDENADVKWLLFGAKAQERLIASLGDADNFLKCSHPRVADFVSENIFAKVPEINWKA